MQSKSHSKALPAGSDTTKPSIHAAETSASPTSTVTSVPEPAGIVEPVKLNPKTVVPPADIVNPLAAASPPLADIVALASTPVTLNWKPAISSSDS